MRCPVDNCHARISIEIVMCRRHWHMVPVHLQHLVWRAWRARQDAQENGHPWLAGTIKNHEEAKRRAIAAVNERQAA